MSKVVVTNGNIGLPTAIQLASKGHEVSLLVRKAESNPELEKLGITFTVADASNPASLEKVFEGIDTFFFVSPLVENMVVLATNLIGAAKDAGVHHIVRSSANGASPNAAITMGRLHGQVEELVKNSGIPFTIVQPAGFFQNYFGSAPTIKSQQAFYGAAGDGKNGLVDVRDIASVAATIIDEGAKHAGRTYIVTGPQALSGYDVANILSEKIGRDIKYVNVSPEDLGKAYKGYGMNDWFVDALLELENITKLGYVSNLSNDVKLVTGNDPISFAEFVEENIEAFK